MKDAIKSILRMKIVAILIILALTFSLTLLNNVTILKKYTLDKAKTVKEFFNVDNTYLIRVQGQSGDLKEYTILDKVAQELKKLKGNGVFTNVYSYGMGSFPVREIIDVEKNPKEYERFGGASVDKNFVERKQIKMIEGRYFNKEDFEKSYVDDNIPILLGSDFKGKYKVGDTFNGEIFKTINEDLTSSDIIKKTYEVIGIIAENQTLSINSKSRLGENSIISNFMVVTPVINEFYDTSDAITLGDFGLFFEVLPNTKVDNIRKEINTVLGKIGEDFGYDLQIKNMIYLKDDLYSPIEIMERDSVLIKILSVVLVVLSSIGIIAVILGELQNRKKEFGIKITQGARYKNLALEIMAQIFLIYLTALILSFAVSFYMNKELTLNLEVILSSIGIISFLTLVISIIPLIKLRSIKPIELVRGK